MRLGRLPLPISLRSLSPILAATTQRISYAQQTRFLSLLRAPPRKGGVGRNPGQVRLVSRVRVVVVRSWFFGHVLLGLSEPSLPPPLGSTELSLPLSLWRQLSPQPRLRGRGRGRRRRRRRRRGRAREGWGRCRALRAHARTTHHTEGETARRRRRRRRRQRARRGGGAATAGAVAAPSVPETSALLAQSASRQGQAWRRGTRGGGGEQPSAP